MRGYILFTLVLGSLYIQAQEIRSIQRLAILRTNQRIVVDRNTSETGAYFPSICVDYDRDAPYNEEYRHFVSHGVSTRITVNYSNGHSVQSNLARAINSNWLRLEARGYFAIKPILIDRNIRSIVILPIQEMPVVSIYRNDSIGLKVDVIVENFPELLSMEPLELQTAFWKKAFLIDLLKSNQKLTFVSGHRLTARSLLMINNLEGSVWIKLFGNTKNYEQLRALIVLDDDGSITRESMNRVMSKILRRYTGGQIPTYWVINTTTRNTGITLSIQESSNRDNGGNPPFIFNNAYQGFRNEFFEKDCSFKICFETQPGDTMNFKVTFEFECENENSGVSESISFSIEYNTADGFSVGADGEQVYSGGKNSVQFVVARRLNPEECKLELTGKYCFPDGPEVELEYCGVRKTVSIRNVRFRF